MANGRSPDDRSSRSSRCARGRGANASGLESLGQQVRGGARPDAVANEAGLQSLGARVDASRSRGGKKRKRPRSPGRIVLRVALGLLALIVLLAAAGYGSFRYEFGRIQTAACASCVSVASSA